MSRIIAPYCWFRVLPGYFVAGLICLLAGMGTSWKAKAQESEINLYREAGQPFIQNFSAKTYGGHQQNWAMIQDSRGVVYIGNLPGVLEFDGVSWRMIRLPNASVVRSLATDSTGVIYVGAHAELGYLAPDSVGSMQYHSLLEHIEPEERTFTNVWKVHVTPQGVYFRTSTHLFRWADNRMQIWKPATEFHRSFWINDTFYIRNWDLGLYSMQNDSLKLAPGGELFADRRIDIMLPFGEQNFLIGTRVNGLFLYDGTTYAPFETDADAYLKENHLYDGLVLSDGTITFATLRGGLVQIDQQGHFLRLIDKNSGLQDNTVWALGTDRENGLWLMLNKGISRVELPSPISVFAERQGLEGSVEDLAVHEGRLYAATTLGVYQMTLSSDPGRAASFNPVPGIASQAWSLLSVGSTLLVATSEGVFQIENARVTRLTEDLSFFLYPSKFDDERIYLGLGNGLGLLQKSGRRWVFEERFEDLTEEIRTIVEDEAGNLWLGSQFHGVVQVKTKLPAPGDTSLEIVRFDASNNMPSGEIKVGFAGQEVFFDTSEGMLVFDEQLQAFVKSNLAEAFTGEAFPDTMLTVQRAVEDAAGRLWVVRSGEGRRKISILPGHTIDRVPPLQQHRSISLQRVQDFGQFWAMYPDPRQEGVLWLGGDEGIVRFDAVVSEKEAVVSEKEDVPYSALVRRVLINQDSLVFGGYKPSATQASITQASMHTFSRPALSSNSSIRFEYAATSLDSPSETQFQYMLEGFDKAWSSWTLETVKEYTNLRAESYRFRVRARNIYRQISREDTFSFTIPSPWYLRWWAYLMYAIPIAISLFFVDRFQRGRLIRRERLKSEVEQARLKTAAAELHARTLQAENELLNAELRFLSVVESANDAVVSANQEGEIIFWNKQAEMIFGWKREEALGRPLTILMPDRHKNAHENGLKRYLETGKKRVIGTVFKQEGVRNDGSEFPLELSLSSWETEEGVFFSAILRDITDQVKAEEELRKVQNQLAHSKKMASLGNLTAGIAHEIKNPLNFVNNFAALTVDLIEEVGDLIEGNKEKTLEQVDQRLVETLSEIKRNAISINKHGHRADSIVRSMMDHVRDGTGKHQPTDLNELVEDTIHLAYQGWLNKNDAFEITIERVFDEAIGQINLAPQEMGRVVLNILENAFDAMHTYAVESNVDFSPTVCIATDRVGEQVEIKISDNGPGMAGEVQEHIFEPFFTTKPTGSGTGLGLSLSYDIVTQGHGGTLTVSSQPGKGATFSIRISM